MISRDVVKFVGYITLLVALVALTLYILISGMELGPIKALSITGIAEKSKAVEKANVDLAVAQQQYDSNTKTLEKAKKDFKSQKEAYELISEETINAVKEATKEEEYLIEYIWITLGNYATAHNLDLAIIEPGGSVSQATSAPSSDGMDDMDVSTGTGITGNETGVNSTTNAATTGSPSSGTAQGSQTGTQSQSSSVTSGLTAKADALTVQVKGSYIDLADFVFEVENDQSLRFRLDNIKMTSAGGTEVITSFNVKDFTVLKFLE